MTGAGLRIAILGGGTAGWMAACLMAKARPAAAITVVESPATIGDGEMVLVAPTVTTLDWMV